MDHSFYLKNGAVLWNGAFTPVDMAVEDGKITAITHGYHNEKGLPEVDAAGLHIRVERLTDHRVEEALVSKLAPAEDAGQEGEEKENAGAERE